MGAYYLYCNYIDLGIYFSLKVKNLQNTKEKDQNLMINQEKNEKKMGIHDIKLQVDYAHKCEMNCPR